METGTSAPSFRIDDEEISEILRKMENNKTPGPDLLCVRALKSPHHYHPVILPELMTACLSPGCFPKSWRIGRVSFIPKPGKDPTKIVDPYRPFTLLSHLAKILERVITDRLGKIVSYCKRLTGIGNIVKNLHLCHGRYPK